MKRCLDFIHRKSITWQCVFSKQWIFMRVKIEGDVNDDWHTQTSIQYESKRSENLVSSQRSNIDGVSSMFSILPKSVIYRQSKPSIRFQRIHITQNTKHTHTHWLRIPFLLCRQWEIVQYWSNDKSPIHIYTQSNIALSSPPEYPTEMENSLWFHLIKHVENMAINEKTRIHPQSQCNKIEDE